MIGTAIHLTTEELEAGLDVIRASPKNQGFLEMIVRRPSVDQRETITEAELDLVQGLVGDDWKQRGSSSTADRSANPEMQLTLMNARVIALVARDRDRWPLAGDQLYVDFDLSEANVPPGTRIAVGAAEIEVTKPPHTGCRKFKDRYGAAALQFVNSDVGCALHLRGVNARIVRPGIIRTGDVVLKVERV